MKKFLISIIIASVIGGLFSPITVSAIAPVISNITFDGIGDSSMRVIFNISEVLTTVGYLRIRYNTSDCASGSGGITQVSGVAGGQFVKYGATVSISGLAPSTLYYICPEATNDGITWSTGVSATVTTLPRTLTTPIPPTTFPTTYPAQSGATLNVASNCSDLQAKMNAAAPGDTIVVPAGTICSGRYTLPDDANKKSFATTSVQTSTSIITVNSHGYTENQEVRISTGDPNGSCLPGMTFFLYQNNCDAGGGWKKGARYYVHVVDTNHVQILDAPSGNKVLPGWITFTANAATNQLTIAPTWATPNGYTYLSDSSISVGAKFQVYSSSTVPGGMAVDTNYYVLNSCAPSPNTLCTFQVATSSGGSAIDLTTSGTNTQYLLDQGIGTMYITSAPPTIGTGQDILLTTSGTLPAAGTRISSTTDDQLFHIRQTTPNAAGDYVFRSGILSHNWHITGMVFDTATNTDYTTTADPRPYGGLFYTTMDTSNIVLDRSRVSGAPYPNRFGAATAIYLNGNNMGWIDSYLDQMNYWHPYGIGFVGSTTTSTSTLTIGKIFAGSLIAAASTTGSTTIVRTAGSATSTIYVYSGMDGHLKIQPPLGVTLTCNSPGATCDVLTGTTTPDWPVNVNGRVAGVKIAVIGIQGVGFTTMCANGCTDPTSSVNSAEGTSAILAGQGPGPYVVNNNFISGTGIPLHFDDAGGSLLPRGDFTITNNYFNTPQGQLFGGPVTDGLWYGNRQPLEWKGGQRLKVNGNTFYGSFSDVTPASIVIAFTPRSGGYTTDVDISNNQFLTDNGGTNSPTPIDSIQPASKPVQRTKISNNLFLLNGVTQKTPSASGRGWAIYGGYANEDMEISHNTAYSNVGNVPVFLYYVSDPISGMVIINNVVFHSNPGGSFRAEDMAGCSFGLGNKAMFDCAFTNGPGNPAYTFAGNLILPAWLDASVNPPSGYIGTSTVNTAFGALTSTNFVVNGTSTQNNIDIVKFNSDYTVATSSPYYNLGTDGLSPGIYTSTSTPTSTPSSTLFRGIGRYIGGSLLYIPLN